MNFYYPLEAPRITSSFGNRVHPVTGVYKLHNGVDFGAKTGTPILAPQSGKVIKKYSNSTGGNQLIVQHKNGYTTGYAHLDSYAVNLGDTVKNGQLLGYVGNTGASTGSHLHFTLKKDGEYLNPEDELKERTFLVKYKNHIIVLIILALLIGFYKYFKNANYGIRIR